MPSQPQEDLLPSQVDQHGPRETIFCQHHENGVPVTAHNGFEPPQENPGDLVEPAHEQARENVGED